MFSFDMSRRMRFEFRRRFVWSWSNIFKFSISNCSQTFDPKIAQIGPCPKTKRKPIDEILKANGKLGKIYCFNQNSQGSQKENDVSEIIIDGVSKTIASYDQEIDRVKIEEVKNYVWIIW